MGGERTGMDGDDVVEMSRMVTSNHRLLTGKKLRKALNYSAVKTERKTRVGVHI